jgi:hypothetical protein
MREMLVDAVTDGTIAPTDIRMTAFALAGALNWPARWYDPAGPLSVEQLADALVDILMRGLDPR